MTARRRPWLPGAATAAGSLPGVDPSEAVRTVLGEAPLLPWLPELPQRGVHAAMIGRSLAMLVDLPVEIVASGWRVADSRSRDQTRARDLLARDLDALEELGAEHAGPLKVQAAGPWTLAASLELRTGHAVLSDVGARRDLAQSLAAGLGDLVADLGKRLPAAQVVLQIDEPSLPAVLAGRIPTPSGYGSIAAVDAPVAQEALRALIDGSGAAACAAHCCAPDAPIALLAGAGFDALSLDAAMLRSGSLDPLGEAIDAGASLWLGVLDARSAAAPSIDAAMTAITALWSRLGFGPSSLASDVVPSTACGLAAASPQWVRRALSVLRRTGEALLEASA